MYDVSEIVAHEADEPNAVVDLLDADALAGKHGRDVDFLPIEADAPATRPPPVEVAMTGDARRPLRSAARPLRPPGVA